MRRGLYLEKAEGRNQKAEIFPSEYRSGFSTRGYIGAIFNARSIALRDSRD
jgi:hypothetical protein